MIRATRGRGIILSSEAKSALGVRGPYDVINLATVWGLGQERGKEAVCEEAGKVVRLAEMKRKSFRGVIDVVDGGRLRNAEEKAEEQKRATAGKKPSGKETNPAEGAEKEKDKELGLSNGTSNGLKRKASTSSFAATPKPAESAQADEKPLSKREQKRRAKKARLEGKAGLDSTAPGVQDTPAFGFPINHVALNDT